jgi:UDP-N-acetylglucosamine:LPS N-acetylglucosamine transferase
MKMKKQIVFIENGPSEMLAKVAYILKKKGYETVLVSITGDLENDFLKDSYNKRVSFDFRYFKLNFKNLPKIFAYGFKKIKPITKSLFTIITLRPCIVLARSNPSWMCAAFKFIFKKYPFIYFPYDIRSSAYYDLKSFLFYSVLQVIIIVF